MSLESSRELQIPSHSKISYEKFLLPTGIGFFVLIACAFFLLANPLGLIFSTVAIILLAGGMGAGALVFGGSFFQLIDEIKEEREYFERLNQKSYGDLEKILHPYINEEGDKKVSLDGQINVLPKDKNEDEDEDEDEDEEKEEKQNTKMITYAKTIGSVCYSLREFISILSQYVDEEKDKEIGKLENLIKEIEGDLQNIHTVRKRLNGIKNQLINKSREILKNYSPPLVPLKSSFSKWGSIALVLLGLAGIVLLTFNPFSVSLVALVLLKSMSILIIGAGIVGLALSYYFINLNILEVHKKHPSKLPVSGPQNLEGAGFRRYANIAKEMIDRRNDSNKSRRSNGSEKKLNLHDNSPRESNRSGASSEGRPESDHESDVSFRANSSTPPTPEPPITPEAPPTPTDEKERRSSSEDLSEEKLPLEEMPVLAPLDLSEKGESTAQVLRFSSGKIQSIHKRIYGVSRAASTVGSKSSGKSNNPSPSSTAFSSEQTSQASRPPSPLALLSIPGRFSVVTNSKSLPSSRPPSPSLQLPSGRRDSLPLSEQASFRFLRRCNTGTPPVVKRKTSKGNITRESAPSSPFLPTTLELGQNVFPATAPSSPSQPPTRGILRKSSRVSLKEDVEKPDLIVGQIVVQETSKEGEEGVKQLDPVATQTEAQAGDESPLPEGLP